MTKRLLLAAALAAAAGLVISGCAAGGAGGGTASGSSAATGTLEHPLQVASSDPENMIPGNSYAYYLQQLMFDPLMTIDQESGEPVPLVAESVSSDDQQTWTITLHDSWTFHNGDPVTAQNYADAWNATAYGPNAWVNNVYFTQFEGYDAMNPQDGSKPTVTELSGVTVVSDTELTVTLVKPNGLFPYTLANPGLSPMPTEAFDDLDAFNKAPIGNGAFRIEGEYAPQATYHVVSYDDYAGQKPTVEAIDMVPYTDRSTAFNDLLAGNLDTVYPVPAQRLQEMESKLPDHFARSTIPNLNYFAMPTWDERFQDPRVRQAISMAIDREALASSILSGSGEAAFAMAPPSAVGARENTCSFCQYDPAEAKKLLEAAGGFEGQLVLYGSKYSVEDQVLQAISNQLAKNLGIDVTIKLDPEAYNNFTAKKLDGPTLSYWGAYFPHIEAMVEPFYSSAGAGNITEYKNPELDALLAQGDATTGDEAITAYQQAEDLALQDMYVVPLYFGIYTAAWNDSITSVPTGPNGYGNLGQTVLAP